MKTQPLVSVLVPVFNGERYLSQALDSLQNQTYSNLEIILVNDGSTDGSAAIIDGFGGSDKRAVVVHKKNTGLTDTLNYGLSLANGVWLSRHDSDDIASVTKVERQINIVTANPSLVLIGSDFSTLTEATGQLRRYHLPTRHNQLVSRLQKVRSFFPHSSALFRLDAAHEVGGYDKDALCSEDWDLWLKFSELGEIASVPDSLVTIRKHHLQMTRNSGDVLPQAEALVSSVLHHLRTDPVLKLSSQDLREMGIRDEVRQSDKYKEFCRIVRLQDKVQNREVRKRILLAKLIRLLSMAGSESLSLLKYITFGTTLPKSISLDLRKSIPSSSQRRQESKNP